MRVRTLVRTVSAGAAALLVATCGAANDADGEMDQGNGGVDTAAPDAASIVEASNYFGLYGDENDPDALRGTYFVTEARTPPGADFFPEMSPGYIMIGAVWADVAPWYMKPLSETRFEQDFLSDFEPEALRVTFELDADGRAVALIFENRQEEFRHRVRTGELPDEYR